MPVMSVGDAAQQFLTQRSGGNIKTELSQLAESLSTGRVTDVTEALGGETTRLSGLNYSLTQLDGYAQVTSETQQRLSTMQTALDRVNAIRAETSSQLLLLSEESTGGQIDEAAVAARDTLDTIVATLNTQLADRALFSGSATDRAPLIDAEAMLADLQTVIGGATDLTTITAAIDTWFDDPAGGFATLAYQGDTGAAPVQRVSDTKSYAIDARADDPAIRAVLKGAAFAAIASELPAIDFSTKTDLLMQAGQQLFVSADDLIGVQARLGYVEQGIDLVVAENAAQRTAYEISRNDLTSADPFETASRLQAVQLQLETHYAMTARLSQLSLLNYI